ncbi:MAG: hypothetical protein KKG99_13125 [Bacteroidetes bacterium]|nr:hypothetical protein [Bacteroidota bacterium]
MSKSELDTKFNAGYYNLSIRAKNILKDIKLGTFEDFYEHFVHGYSVVNFHKIRNCGSKTQFELRNFYNELEECYIKSGLLREEDTTEEYLEEKVVFSLKKRLIFKKKLQLISIRAINILTQLKAANISGFYDNIIRKKNKNFIQNVKNCGQKTLNEIKEFELTILELIHDKSINNESDGILSDLKVWLFENENFRDVELNIIHNYLMLDQGGTAKTYQAIGTDHGLTRERVRQITEKIPLKIKKIINTLKQNYNYEIYSYFQGDCLEVTEKFVKQLNTSQDTNFSKAFIIFVLSSIDHPQYSFVNTEKKFRDYNGFFIRKDIPFNSEECYKYLKGIHSRRRKKDLEVPLRDLIEFCKIGELLEEEGTLNEELNEMENRIIKVFGFIATILSSEENEISINTESIIFKKNTYYLIHEHIVKILNEFNKPMHYEDIYNECIKRGITATSPLSVHATLTRNTEVFGLKGQGKYGLLEWGGYFGKIGDVAERKIREYNKPIDRKELEEFLSRELYISQSSISVVLFNYELENRFVKLKNDKITLREWDK